MAIFRAEESGVWYYGLSSDTKPTDDRVHVGDKFWETDTGVQAVYNGSAWVELTQPANPS